MSTDAVEVWLSDATLGPDAMLGTLHRGMASAPARFVYHQAWLDSMAGPKPFALSHDLPLARGSLFARDGSLHDVFRDMTPDRWGQVLMDQREAVAAREQQRAKKQLRPFDYLLGLSDVTRMGALRLRDPASGEYIDDSHQAVPPVTRLREIQHVAEEIQKADADDNPAINRWLRLLVQPGSAMCGARPKAVFVEDDGSMWLAKFPSSKDKRDWGRWEFLAHQLAINAGIEMPRAKLFNLSEHGHTYAVERFDRAQGSRRMFCSAMTLLSKSDGDEPSFYWEIADAIARHGDKDHRAHDLAQLYRRIYFSILIANRDDHLRNHGFLRTENGWRLSPAFDINPNPDKDAHELYLGIDADLTPSSALLRDVSEYYFVDYKSKARRAAAAEKVEAEVRGALAGWQTVANGLGIARAQMQDLEAIINLAR